MAKLSNSLGMSEVFEMSLVPLILSFLIIHQLSLSWWWAALFTSAWIIDVVVKFAYLCFVDSLIKTNLEEHLQFNSSVVSSTENTAQTVTTTFKISDGGF